MDLGRVDVGSDEGCERLKALFRYGQVGSCVNSVTHDLNNYLGAVLAYADLLSLDGANLSPDSQRMLRQIMDAVQRCSALLSALTSIARKPKDDATMVELSGVVNKVVDLRRYDFRVAQIELSLALEEGLPSLVIDMPKFEIALLCLLSNAFDAVHGSPAARVTVSLGVSSSRSETLELAVWDSAGPIPPEVRDAMFEPFFTSKPGNHIGLGLSMARDVVRYHGGELGYDERKGMVMYLPRRTALAVDF